MKTLLRGTALIAVLMAGACVHAPDVAPVLDLADRDCAATPSLAGAFPTEATVDGDREKPAITTMM